MSIHYKRRYLDKRTMFNMIIERAYAYENQKHRYINSNISVAFLSDNFMKALRPLAAIARQNKGTIYQYVALTVLDSDIALSVTEFDKLGLKPLKTHTQMVGAKIEWGRGETVYFDPLLFVATNETTREMNTFYNRSDSVMSKTIDYGKPLVLVAAKNGDPLQVMYKNVQMQGEPIIIINTEAAWASDIKYPDGDLILSAESAKYLYPPLYTLPVKAASSGVLHDNKSKAKNRPKQVARPSTHFDSSGGVLCLGENTRIDLVTDPRSRELVFIAEENTPEMRPLPGALVGIKGLHRGPRTRTTIPYYSGCMRLSLPIRYMPHTGEYALDLEPMPAPRFEVGASVEIQPEFLKMDNEGRYLPPFFKGETFRVLAIHQPDSYISGNGTFRDYGYTLEYQVEMDGLTQWCKLKVAVEQDYLCASHDLPTLFESPSPKYKPGDVVWFQRGTHDSLNRETHRKHPHWKVVEILPFSLAENWRSGFRYEIKNVSHSGLRTRDEYQKALRLVAPPNPELAKVCGVEERLERSLHATLINVDERLYKGERINPYSLCLSNRRSNARMPRTVSRRIYQLVTDGYLALGEPMLGYSQELPEQERHWLRLTKKGMQYRTVYMESVNL